MSFALSHPALLRALTERGYGEPTPVQAAILQPDTAGRDLLVSAQTGSGKTVAYGLALAETLLGEAERFESRGQPLAVIVAPTRERVRSNISCGRLVKLEQTTQPFVAPNGRARA